jgi:hypothetical protein
VRVDGVNGAVPVGGGRGVTGEVYCTFKRF